MLNLEDKKRKRGKQQKKKWRKKGKNSDTSLATIMNGCYGENIPFVFTLTMHTHICTDVFTAGWGKSPIIIWAPHIMQGDMEGPWYPL